MRLFSWIQDQLDQCYRSVTGGKTTKFSNLKFSNVSKIIFWGGNRLEIYVDLDGSLSGIGSPGMITPIYPHLTGIPGCVSLTRSLYEDSVFCNSQMQLISVMFTNIAPPSMINADIRVLRIPNINYNLSSAAFSDYSVLPMPVAIDDKKYSWEVVFATGYLYNIHWSNGNLDFSNLETNRQRYYV